MNSDKNILIAFILNCSFSFLEFIGGFITGSIAITSDSIHDLGDAISIGLSYFLEKISKKNPDNNHTYGYIRYSILGSIITTTILITGSIFVIIESINRFANPVEIKYDQMILFAVFGVVINLIASYATKEGESLNQKAVNLHMLEDVLGWVVVLIGSILIKYTNILLFDSILSIIVALFILFNAIINLKKVIDIFLDITPKNVNIEELKKHLINVDNVLDVHHIHVRSLDGYNNIATLHVVVDKYNEKIKENIRMELQEHNICHSTIEIELPNEVCDKKYCIIKNNNKKVHHH